MDARVVRNKRLDRRVALVLAMMILALGVSTAIARAQTGGGYDLTWYTIDGGGGAVSGGPYTLVGAAGQADGGEVGGGGYVLSGGFWSGGPRLVFLPLVLR